MAAPVNRVFVHNLPWSVTDEALQEFMSRAGTVRTCTIMRMRDNRSKGCAVAEYATVEDAQNAIATLNDEELEGRKLLVREDREGPEGPAPRAEREPAAPRPARGGRGGGRGGAASGRAPAGGAGGNGGEGGRPAAAPGTSVYVGNLAWAVTWKELKDAFAAFQPSYADVKQDRDGRSRGWGILRFATPEVAQQAIEQMNNVEINGRPMAVRLDRD